MKIAGKSLGFRTLVEAGKRGWREMIYANSNPCARAVKCPCPVRVGPHAPAVAVKEKKACFDDWFIPDAD